MRSKIQKTIDKVSTWSRRRELNLLFHVWNFDKCAHTALDGGKHNGKFIASKAPTDA